MNVDATLAQLEEVQLIHPAIEDEPTYMFKHVLTQEAAYGSLLRQQRRELHQRVAKTIEALYADRLDEYAALLAQHYGEAGDDAKTLEFATRAGDMAARVYANAEAVQYYSQAIDTAKRIGAIHESPLRDLYLKRGRVLELMGRINDALANYHEMESLGKERGDRALKLGALIALAIIQTTPTIVHNAEAAKRLSENALGIAREIGDRASEAKVLWNLQNLAFFTNDLRAGIAYGEQALAVARQFALREQMAYTLNDISRIYAVIGETTQAMLAIQDAKKIWDELGNLPMLADNLASAGETCLYAGALDDALRYSEQAIELAKSIANPWVQGYALWIEGLVYFERGEMDHATAAIGESFRFAEQAGFGAAQLGGQSDLALMYSYFGAYDRAIELCQRTIERAAAFKPFLPWAWAHLSLIYARQGNLAASAQAAFQARDTFQSKEFFIYLTIPLALAESADALAQEKYSDAITAIAPIIARYHETGIAYHITEAFLAQARAWLAQGELDRAEEMLNQARTIAEKMSSRQILWKILLAQSRVAEARGESAQAETLRGQARDIVTYIADHAGGAELSASFLALPDVRAVMKS